MQKLKLKAEFEGIIATKKCYNLGDVTFNTMTTPESLYHNFFRIEAFTNMFHYVEVCDKCQDEKCICKKVADDKLDEAKEEVKKYTGVKQTKK